MEPDDPFDELDQYFSSFDHLFKLVLIGDSHVGKTSFLSCVTEEPFNEKFMPTIGVDFRIKNVHDEFGTTKIQLWDTAGQERFKTITHSYYRGTDAAIIFFDISNLESFLNVEQWINEYMANSFNKEMLLVGNKIDLECARAVSYDVALQYAMSKGIKYRETSAKAKTNAKEILEELIRDLRKKRIKSDSDNVGNTNFSIGEKGIKLNTFVKKLTSNCNWECKN